jgi:hypothetical protein
MDLDLQLLSIDICHLSDYGLVRFILSSNINYLVIIKSYIITLITTPYYENNKI